MGEFLLSGKSNQTYLDTAINGNGSEKAALTLAGLDRLRKQHSDEVHIIEIGPGGGSAVNAIANSLDKNEHLRDGGLHVSFLELDGIESNKLHIARQKIGQYATTSFHQGNAEQTNEIFKDGADIIAASAVMHEVYSYGDGYHSIDNTIGAITNTLNPGGFFAYRDVFSVHRLSQHERTRHVYDRESWVRFSQLFLSHYLKEATHPYHRQEDRIIFEQDSKRIDVDKIDAVRNLSIDAPVGLLREVQRHYITLRDHVWRDGTLGVKPILEGDGSNDWLDVRRGHKRVHFTQANHDPLLAALSETGPDESRIIDGDIFDATTDELLIKFLKDAAEDETSESYVAWQDWLKREGAETYTYMTLNKFIGSVAMQSFIASDAKKILLPIQQSDVQVIPRVYYNRFLERTLSNPLPDGKQLVLFEAVDTDDKSSKNKEKIFQALETLDEHCSRETLAEMYTPIRKVFSNLSTNQSQ